MTRIIHIFMQNTGYMKKLLITLALAAAVAFSASAQNNSIGLSYRPGFSSVDSQGLGLEFKHYFSSKTDLDIRGYYLTNGWGSEFIGLYEWNFPIAEGFKFYAGPGANFGFCPNSSSDGRGNTTITYGFAGVGGIQYDFFGAPIALSLDWQPIVTWQTTYTGALWAWDRMTVGLKFNF